MDNDVQMGNMDTGGPGTGVAHAWPTRSPFDKGHVWSASTRFPGHACPSGLQIFEKIFFFFLPGASDAAGRLGPPVAHLWTTRGPPVAQPDLVEMSRLGREEFRATWMPDLPDRPEMFPSFAYFWPAGSHHLRNCLGVAQEWPCTTWRRPGPCLASRPPSFVKISPNYQPAAQARPDFSAV